MNDNKKVQGIDSKIWELSDEIVLPITFISQYRRPIGRLINSQLQFEI